MQVPWKKFFAKLPIGLLRRTPASEVPFLDALLPLGVGGSEGGAVFGHWSPLEHWSFAFH